jgi:Domain of unknown function (DUF4946)
MNTEFVQTRRRALLGLVGAFSGALGIRAASADTTVARPYQVTWPSGWDVSYLPSPTTNSGKILGGERVRVLLKSEGVAVVAAIELTYFPRSDNGRASLVEEFDLLRDALRTGYERQKFKVSLTPTTTLAMGGQSALKTELSVTNESVKLKQWMGVALSPQFLYSLSFTASDENFVRYRPQFEKVMHAIAFR